MDRLVLKLKAHGIGNGIFDWIEQLLTDRRQCDVVEIGFQLGTTRISIRT